MQHEEGNPLSFLETGARWIIDALARVLVVLFDGVKIAVDHASPSMFALVSTALPYLLPLPVALMSSYSAQRFFAWEPWAANVLGFGLEGLGLLAWVRLTDAILETIRSNNRKVTVTVALYGLVAVAYEALLIILNSVLAHNDGASGSYTMVLTLVCLLPALSALIYGFHKQLVERELAAEKQESKDLAERIRQERRQDRKELQAMKMQYAADVTREKLDQAPFRGRSKQP